jgi:D-threo-aldose 1-dehydrogenase
MTAALPVTRLGHSGIPVTRLSFGSAALGNLFTEVHPLDATAAIEAAWRSGIRYYDTAPHYGLGLAEERLGAALRTRPRNEFVLSTKVGRLVVPGGDERGDDHGFAVPRSHRRVWDFSPDGVRRSLLDSLTRLNLDHVDVAYLHDPDDHAEIALSQAYPELERLRAEGVLGAIGVGANHTAVLARFLRETDIDVALLAGRYTLLDQSGLDDVLPLAADRGCSVVIGGVFNSGLLTYPAPDRTYDYSTVPPSVLDRALRIQEVTERHGVPLRAAALRFPFGHPAVASVLVGPRDSTEMRDCAAMAVVPVPAAMWDELRAEGLLADHVPTPGGA